nr:hypothetical protein [Tanacetum cinerariifolium]
SLAQSLPAVAAAPRERAGVRGMAGRAGGRAGGPSGSGTQNGDTLATAPPSHRRDGAQPGVCAIHLPGYWHRAHGTGY